MALLCWCRRRRAGAKRDRRRSAALAEPLANMVRPMPYPEMYPPEDPDYHPTAVARTMFLDAVDVGTGQGACSTRCESSDAPLRAAQLRVLGGAVARVPADATAYAHRSSRIMANVAAFYDGAGRPAAPRGAGSRRPARRLHSGDDRRLRQLPGRRGRGAGPRGLPRRDLGAAAGGQGDVRPGEPLPAQPERPAGGRARAARFQRSRSGRATVSGTGSSDGTGSGRPPRPRCRPSCAGAEPVALSAMRWRWGRQRWVGPLVCAALALAGCNSAVDRAGGGGDPQPTVLRLVDPLFGLEAQPFVDAVRPPVARVAADRPPGRLAQG